jgi:serine/threonine-protein kinase HipA
VQAFLDAVAFNWLIGGSDAHGKNYSLLHGPRSTRLAPLYDLISAEPYPRLGHSLSMSIGGERRPDAVRTSHWREVARDAGVNGQALIERIRALGSGLPAAMERALLPLEGIADFRALAGMGLIIAERATARVGRLSSS